MKPTKVLVVEDEEVMRSILRRLLEKEGFEVFTADSAESALRVFPENDIAVTLTDIRMAGLDGIELLDQIKSIDPDALVIIMTAFSSVDSAVAALRKGAYDYITKPFVNEDLLQTVKNAIAQQALFRENRALRRELDRHYKFSDIVGRSEALRRIFQLVEKVADTKTTVLIRGESGTGKELIAKAIHFNSSRAAKPFLAINCGALPETLLESELFGHVKGSFTGAVANKPGLFRSAEGGTLLLDEVGEMPVPLQVRLLRALQEHEVVPVGSSTAVKFDARIVAATNSDLQAEVEAGRFREDLYYRLNVVEIVLPPLRERSEDIPLLAAHFVGKAARKHDRPTKPITESAADAIQSFGWPGNIRELENVIERAFVLSDDQIDIGDLPEKLRAAHSAGSKSAGTNERPTLEDVEREYIRKVMETEGQDKVAAAKVLGIDLSTLYRRLKRYEAE